MGRFTPPTDETHHMETGHDERNGAGGRGGRRIAAVRRLPAPGSGHMYAAHQADNPTANVSELILKLQAQRRAIAAAATATDRILEEIAVSLLVPRPARAVAAVAGHGAHGAHATNCAHAANAA